MEKKSDSDLRNLNLPISDEILITEVDNLLEWKPRRQEHIIILSLSLISLMVALDESILIAAIQVSL
jgi:hypothetical protein